MHGGPARSRLFNTRVGRRMLVLFLLCAMVPVVVGGALVFSITEAQLERQTYDDLRRSTRSAGLWLYDRLLSLEETASLLGTRMSADDGGGGLAAASRRRGQAERLLGVSLRSPDGTVTPLLGPALSVPPLSPAQLRHLDGGGSVVEVGTAASGRAQVLLLRRVSAGPDAPMMIIEPHPDFVWNTGEAAANVCVTTLELVYLHCPQGLDAAVSSAVLEARRDAMGGRLVLPERYVYYWTLFFGGHFASDSWLVILERDEAAGAIATRKQFLYLAPALLLLIVLFVLLMSLMQIRRFTEPLTALMQATQRLGQGQRDIRVHLVSDDEFQRLGDSFNTMADGLDETFSTLEGFSEIDTVVLTTDSPADVQDAVASALCTLTLCERGALLCVSPTGEGAMRASARGLPFRLGDSAAVLEPDAVEFMERNRHAREIVPGERLPSCLGQMSDAPDARVLWAPFSTDGSYRGAMLCVFEPSASLTEPRRQRVLELARRVTVALDAAHKTEVLYRQAHVDSLTGLANRNSMDQALEAAIDTARADGSEVALLFIDLDRFKAINDSLGHTHGDHFLVEFATRLRSAAPAGATIARFGGDEFVCVLPCPAGRGETAARELARTITLVVNGPFRVAKREVLATVSIGIGLYPEHASDAAQLLKDADVALFRAKASGRDRWMVFKEEFATDASRRMEIEIALREALRNDELSLAYQPQIDLHTGEVAGVEALLRWPDCPVEGVGPALFISVAEESRLVVDLGAWVVRAACAQLRAWQEQGIHDLVMSINLSPRDFLNPGLPVQIAEALRQNDLEGRLLELEITERSVMSDIDATLRALQALRTLGVRIAVDDFGTGHSSLEYLARLPVDTLKVDQSFVRAALRERGVRAIVETVIDLAHKLDMSVVAEGVEQQAQLEMMRADGCDLVQGYLFARPMYARDFEAWWRDYLARRPAVMRAVGDGAD